MYDYTKTNKKNQPLIKI